MSDIHTLRYIKPVPVLPCTDIDRTISFFAELTGWKVSGKHPGFVAISAGFGSEVTIWYKEEEAREESGLGLGEVVVLLEEGEAPKLYKLLQNQSHSVPIKYARGGDQLEPKPWGFTQFTLLDPDGNKITFASHTKQDAARSEVDALVAPEL